MPKRLDLPAVVYLRTQPALRPAEAYAAINASRQRVHQWRSRGHGFPPTIAGRINTSALARWLTDPARGCRLIWV